MLYINPQHFASLLQNPQANWDELFVMANKLAANVSRKFHWSNESDREDAISDVTIVIMNNLSLFDPTRGNPFVYFTTAAFNGFRMFFRSRHSYAPEAEGRHYTESQSRSPGRAIEPTLETVIELRQAGLGCRLISKALNDKGFVTKRGNSYTPNRVYDLLRKLGLTEKKTRHGRNPYGFLPNGKPDEKELPILKTIVQLATLNNYASIAATLNEKHLPRRCGLPWGGKDVRNVYQTALNTIVATTTVSTKVELLKGDDRILLSQTTNSFTTTYPSHK